MSHRRYFNSGYPRRDHEDQLALVLLVFETERAEVDFPQAAAGTPEVPPVSATTGGLDRNGVLGPAWCRPARPFGALAARIRNGELALPEMQRSYVWNRP